MDISTDYSSIYGSYTDISAEQTSSSLTSLDLTEATDDELMEVCEDFESYLVEQMYKAMEKTIMKDEDEESDSIASKYTDYFGDMQIQEYAKMSTETGGLGIAQMLYEQLKVNVTDTISQAAEEQAAEVAATSDAEE